MGSNERESPADAIACGTQHKNSTENSGHTVVYMLLPVLLLFLLVALLKVSDYSEKNARRGETFASHETRPELSSLDFRKTDDYLRKRMRDMARDDVRISASGLKPVSEAADAIEKNEVCSFLARALNEFTGFDFVVVDVNSCTKQAYVDMAVFMVDVTMHDMSRFFSRQIAATVIFTGKSFEVLRIGFANDDVQDVLHLMSSDVGIKDMETPAPWVNIYAYDADVSSKTNVKT